MHLLSFVWLALLAVIANGENEYARMWSVMESSEQESQINNQYQQHKGNNLQPNGQYQQQNGNNPQANGQYQQQNGNNNQQIDQYQQQGLINQQNDNAGDQYNQNDTAAASFNVDQIIDTILASSRQGRNLDGFDEVYSDPTVQDALQKGDDSQARNLIKDKLCSLGLMQCENVENVGKFLPSGELIYAQPPNGYRPGPPRPPTRIYGSPRPMPPPNHNFVPPRKVGYGPTHFQQGPIYHSKPPGFSGASSFPGSTGFAGQVFDSPPPYKFDSMKEQILSNEEYHALMGLGDSGPVKTVVNDGITGTGANSVNVHHHYHHIDGADSNKGGAVLSHTVPIPVPVPVQVGNGLVTGEFSSLDHHSGSNGFGPLSSGYEHQSFKQTGSFNGISSGGVYGAGSKPVFESAQNYDAGTGSGSFGNSGFGATGAGNAGVVPTGLGSSGFGGGHGSFGQSSYASGSGSFHATNPDFYKKALKGGSGLNSLNSYNQQYSGGYGGLYSNGQNHQGYESARQDNFDCVCVPYDQCPARDILGRKGDLILPLDPRNLGSDIEALNDDTNAKSNSTVNRVAKEIGADDNNSDEKTNDDDAVEQSKEEVKHISKREVAEEKSSDVAKADGQARLFGIGGGAAGLGVGGLGGVGVGLSPKKVEPQFGVSFGLPYPTGGYPLNTFNGGYPAQNPYFGSISPNGLNLGLVNVNPLVSFQFAKNEYGQKTFKPLVNLHVTPNAQLISKVGNLFKGKQYGSGGGYGQSSYNQHYHTHTHYPGTQSVYHPHHYESGPTHFSSPGHFSSPEHYSSPGHFSSPGHYSSGPGEFYPSEYDYSGGAGNGYGLTGPGGYYRNSLNQYDESGATGPSNDYNQDGNTSPYYSDNNNPNHYYSRSINGSAVGSAQEPIETNDRYASSYDQAQNQNQNPIQNAVNNNIVGAKSVSFPSTRRKRSTDTQTIDGKNLNAANVKIIEKRQSYNSIQQQCGPSQVCCRRGLNVGNQQFSKQPGQCGRRNTQGITGRIKNPVYVDGDSEFGEYPWQVAILKKDPKESVYVCGGTLIDGQHILTAAHCVKTYSGYDLRVRLGEWDVNHDVEFFPYIERDVASVHVHPEYYAGTLDNDLAILKLNGPVDFVNNPHISPACLPDRNSDFTGARCWTTGWGKDAFGDFGKYQNILKEVDVPIIGHQQCQQQLRNTRLGYTYQLNPGFVCAGGEEGKDACKGDGGGPMVCERNGIWQLVGVVSWGIGCGQVNVPGVYVNVAHYLDWIHQISQQQRF